MLCNRRFIAYDLPTNYTMDPFYFTRYRARRRISTRSYPPLYETKTSEDASAWTAMMQSGGYIMGGFIPVLAGIARDYFDSYTQVLL